MQKFNKLISVTADNLKVSGGTKDGVLYMLVGRQPIMTLTLKQMEALKNVVLAVYHYAKAKT